MPLISVVVPCYPPHQKHIPKLLEQLNKQTLKPDVIIISLSEVSEAEIKERQYSWTSLTEIPLQVVGQAGKALAAVNRNYGALYVYSEYVLFLDADDVYHEKLIEVLHKYICIHEPDAILYHLTEGAFDATTEPVQKKFYESSTLFDIAYPDKKRNSVSEMYNDKPQLFLESTIHHGHSCVRYSVWQECPQDDLKGREDSVYVRALLWNWHETGRKTSGVIVIPEVLTYYEQSLEHRLEYMNARWAAIDNMEANGLSCEVKL